MWSMRRQKLELDRTKRQIPFFFVIMSRKVPINGFSNEEEGGVGSMRHNTINDALFRIHIKD
jgi:hypothetical protein